jgi:hypothetical protein
MVSSDQAACVCESNVASAQPAVSMPSSNPAVVQADVVQVRRMQAQAQVQAQAQ